MAISEVFPKPTVKQVVFQIKYPNLFYLEEKIGDLQKKIMREFPESALLFRRQFMIADVAPDIEDEQKPKLEESKGKKIWQFKCEDLYTLNVMTDSLDISSTTHKTYNNQTEERKFRDVIKLVVDNFLEIVGLPIINRIGLRYIDECPIIEKNNEWFILFYNTAFPLERFNIDEATNMQFSVNTKAKGRFINYSEVLQAKDDRFVYMLDFDGYATKIEASKYLEITDELHDIIVSEYEASIKEPLIELMRRGE